MSSIRFAIDPDFCPYELLHLLHDLIDPALKGWLEENPGHPLASEVEAFAEDFRCQDYDRWEVTTYFFGDPCHPELKGLEKRILKEDGHEKRTRTR